jgi:hypothetical protein
MDRLDLNIWVGHIPKEKSFINLAVRQTSYAETIPHSLKRLDNITKQRKPASMARSSKKMAKENQHVRSTQSTLWLA